MSVNNGPRKAPISIEEDTTSFDESHHLHVPPELPEEPVTGATLDLMKKMFREMLLIRRFEEASAKAYAAGKIGGFCHLYIGQEAVGVGCINALNDDDYIVSTYRDHGHALSRGLEARSLMAELFGKRNGIVKGKGGSMHFFDKKRNFMGGHGIVGGHVALAAGIGWGIKYKKENKVCICFFGEGASNIGAFHESLNLASLWKLPILFVCENNHYSMGTPEYRALASHDVSIRAVAYDMARAHFEGDDVHKVEERVREFAERARRGEGPALLEISTYRFRGHSMSDPAKYRTKEEVEVYRRRDPLVRAQHVLSLSGVPEKEMARLESEIKAIVDDAVDFAEKSEFPPGSDLFTDVYV